ncbi:MAG TPA: hypothetical protein VFQ17_13535 [Nocardioides sp.]|nr:hypothetical protein [Nocardioides sp.]
MGTDRLVVGGAVLAVLLVAGSGVAVRGAADRVRTEDERPPARIEVSCAPGGITVSAREVAAGTAGVTVEVSSTMAEGSSLVLDASAQGWGDPLPQEPATWVRPVPPGDLELTCSTDGESRPGMSAGVRVVDPDGHWRDASLGDAGCTMTGGQPAWKFGAARGDTPEAAVDALLAVMTADSGRVITASDAGLGYPDADTQTWVALSGGGRGFTIDVVRDEAGSPGYAAGPNYLCGGTGKPPAY